MSSDGPPLLRPRPRRPFEIGPLSSTNTSAQPSPDSFFAHSPTEAFNEASSAPPSRSRSILNLTSSTLAGVFGYAADEPATPWGTGAETPIDGPGLRKELGALLDGKSVDEALMKRSKERRGSMLKQSASRSRSTKHAVKQKGFKNHYLPILTKTLGLGVVGVAYGALISHLHDRQNLPPVQVEGLDHASPYYLAFWGLVGITLGWLMPYVDTIWNGDDEEEENIDYRSQDNPKSTGDQRRGSWTPVWNDLVRTMGAFCGIAYAIVSSYPFNMQYMLQISLIITSQQRRIPWHSTLQLSLTLALSNPTFWYLLDRSAPGFILSTTVALSGTALLLGINPDLVPSPSPAHSIVNETLSKANFAHGASTSSSSELVAGLWSNESVAVATWIASVLFVSCVCFGNIGRRL